MTEAPREDEGLAGDLVAQHPPADPELNLSGKGREDEDGREPGEDLGPEVSCGLLLNVAPEGGVRNPVHLDCSRGADVGGRDDMEVGKVERFPACEGHRRLLDPKQKIGDARVGLLDLVEKEDVAAGLAQARKLVAENPPRAGRGAQEEGHALAGGEFGAVDARDRLRPVQVGARLEDRPGLAGAGGAEGKNQAAGPTLLGVPHLAGEEGVGERGKGLVLAEDGFPMASLLAAEHAEARGIMGGLFHCPRF